MSFLKGAYSFYRQVRKIHTIQMSLIHELSATKLTYSKYGNPEEVVLLENNIPVLKPEKNEVLLQMIMAPVNPVDINMIQGKYFLKLPLPAVPGYEGVAKIITVGPEVKSLYVGDLVIPLSYVGTWTTHLIVTDDLLLKVPNNLGLVEAAMLSINPPTVYRMLKDYVNLKSGDTVIQNGANSACGQIVIQICQAWGINTVNIVRDRPEINELKSFLKNLGATYVFTESEIRNTDIFETGNIQKPMLALNCVGGQSATEILRQLDFGAIMVTYGGMSMKPITIPTSALIFKGISLEGFSIGRWMAKDGNIAERSTMFSDLFNMILKGDLKAPSHVLVKLQDYKDALTNTLTSKGMVGKKYLLDFSKVTSKI